MPTLVLHFPEPPNLTGTQAAVYGKCIVADYNFVFKDKCAQEFMRLKDCYLVRDSAPAFAFVSLFSSDTVSLSTRGRRRVASEGSHSFSLNHSFRVYKIREGPLAATRTSTYYSTT